MSKQKAPKVQAEDYLYVESALRDFGIAGVPVRDLIEYIKTGLKSANAAVRTNATKCLVTTRLCVGAGAACFTHTAIRSLTRRADISNFLQDLNPQLLSTIESEFGKIAGEAPPAPTRTSADLAPAAGASGTAKGKGKAAAEAATGADPLDDLFPRVEIDKLVSSSTVKACDDAAWKARKEALEQIQGILEANKRLKPTLGAPFSA